MDVHEYQAKELLGSFGVPVPKGAVAFSPDQAVYAATELGGWSWASRHRSTPALAVRRAALRFARPITRSVRQRRNCWASVW